MANHSGIKETPFVRTLFALSSCFLIFGCGLPQLQDIRKEYAKNVQALGGLTAIYPPREMMRIGQIWIGDASAAGEDDRVKARHTISMLLSDALVTPMEDQRKIRMAEASRFSKSASNLSSDLTGTPTGTSFFKQTTEDSLEIAALPKYTLASVDQAALSGAVPSPTASFLASFGFTQSKYLTMEAVGVEIAELPVDTVTSIVQQACADPNSLFGSSGRRDTVQRVGFYSMQAWWEVRKQDAEGKPIADFKPQLYLLHKVLYMRGIRYIFNDQKAASAVLSAALANQFPAGVTPPTAPAPPPPSPTPNAAPASDTTGTGNAALKAQIDALNAQIAALRSSTAQNGNTNIAGSFARATAQGVELVELFERPMAFGYVAFAENLAPGSNGQWSGGIAQFCDDFK